MWPYPWTHVGTPSHLGHMDRMAATMPSQAHAGAAQEAPDIGQWEGQDVPLVRPSPAMSKEASRAPEDTYLPTSQKIYSTPLTALFGLRFQNKAISPHSLEQKRNMGTALALSWA